MKIKKMILLLTAAVLLLTSCVKHAQTDDGKLSIVTTNFAMYDFARAAAGDCCEVTMLVSPGSESHDFEAALADIAKISTADVFVHIGSEDWVDDIFTAMGDEAEGIRVVNALEVTEERGSEQISEDGVCVISGEHAHGHAEHEHEHAHALDEHCWMSLGNAAVMMDAVTSAIISADESLAEQVTANAEKYLSLLETIDHAFFALMQNAQRTKIVVADRFPYAYMTARYGIDYEAAFSGCTSDTEPSLDVINTLIETVKTEKIPVVFVTENSDRRTAEAVAAETGAQIRVLYSAQSVTKAEFENGVTLAYFMQKNFAALKEALGADGWTLEEESCTIN